jgi:hypothetical protein
MSEFIDLNELTRRVPLSKRTIMDQIAQGRLLEGVHFRRPTGPGGKLIFFWSAIELWVKGQDFGIRREKMAKRA